MNKERHINAANCETCAAMDAMKREEQTYLARWLSDVLDGWLRPRATTTRDPFRFSVDDVLDASEALKKIDRIPSEWRA